jgi:tripeptidyl-peptidase-1
MVLRWTIAAGLLATAIVAAAAPQQQGGASVVHERRHAQHELAWTKRSRVPASHTFEMRVGLAQRNLDRGYEMLMDVSDPGSPNYGRHWTQDEVVQAFRPSGDAVQAAKGWVVASGIDAERVWHAASGGWLVFNATVEEAERLLETEYWLYEHESEQMTAGCDESVSLHGSLMPCGVLIYVVDTRSQLTCASTLTSFTPVLSWPK